MHSTAAELAACQQSCDILRLAFCQIVISLACCVQEDLQDRSHELEGTEMKLARYVQQLKKSKMRAARLDGRLTFLMREFESQNAFSEQTSSAQKAPAATEPASEATEGNPRAH